MATIILCNLSTRVEYSALLSDMMGQKDLMVHESVQLVFVTFVVITRPPWLFSGPFSRGYATDTTTFGYDPLSRFFFECDPYFV